MPRSAYLYIEKLLSVEQHNVSPFSSCPIMQTVPDFSSYSISVMMFSFSGNGSSDLLKIRDLSVITFDALFDVLLLLSLAELQDSADRSVITASVNEIIFFIYSASLSKKSNPRTTSASSSNAML